MLKEDASGSTKPEEYYIDLMRHCKIWFTSNPGEFMPMLNQLRLIRMRALNPDIKLSLIYARELLSPEAQAKMVAFTQAHGIDLVDLRSIEAELDPASPEPRLYRLLLEELQSECGNLGSASDIARVLSPIAAKGIYSDLDRDFFCRPEVEALKVTFDGASAGKGKSRALVPLQIERNIRYIVCNDVLALLLPISKTGDISEIRKALLPIQMLLLSRYENPNYLSLPMPLFTMLFGFLPVGASWDTSTIFLLRKSIKNMSLENFVTKFSEEFREWHSIYKEIYGRLCLVIDILIKEEQQLCYQGSVVLEYRRLLSESFFTASLRLLAMIKETLIKRSVTDVSGPEVFWEYLTELNDPELHSCQKYGLGRYFHNGKDANESELPADFFMPKSDMSWTESGRAELNQYGEKLDRAVLFTQHRYRYLHAKRGFEEQADPEDLVLKRSNITP